MALDTYREKRRFERTPEPEGGDEGRVGPLRFTVQKHRASHLHYDFRLEMDGVLKSWAVPKGPSLNPEDKRLAMMVEDHPLDYRLFEGVIPKGSYGAGTVMVWDEGVYLPRQPAESREENERNLLHGLHKGHITFLVEGTKLHGEFALVKIQRDEKNSWLLLKKGDQYAGTNDVLEEDRSSISGRTMDEIATQSASAGDVWRTPGKRVEIDLSDAPTLDMPHHIAPMLATPAANPFDRAGWLFEIKWDGYRAIAEIEGKNVNLYSRSKRPFDDIYTPIVRSLHAMANEAVLDGELVVLDDNSKPRFQLLQNYATERKGTLAYYVFDVLYLDGHDLRPLPLRRRKEILRRILPAASNIRFSDHVEERGKDFYALAAQQSLEGVVAKRADSRYLSGRRTAEWVKIKTEQRQDAVIAGFTAPRGSRHDLGALVLGVYEADELIYIGHSGTGMDEATLSDLRARLEPLIRETPAFKTRPKTNAPAQWVEPRLVCSVSFKEWTRDGTMRHPVFMGLREDVAAEGVHRESGPEDEPAVEDTALIDADPESAPPHTTREEPHANGSTPSSAVPTPAAADLVPAVPTAGQEDETPDSPNPSPRIPSSSPQTPTGRTFKLLKKQERETEIDGRLLKLTNLDKPYWPADGYKKRDLIAYYREVAPVVLPYLRDRPESLHRHPNGVGADSFFQKDLDHHPSWVETIPLRSEGEARQIEYLLCQNEATLVYMANLGCIEINPWNSRLESLDRPDYLVIDLDPETIGFDRVVETALALRAVLAAGEVEGFCKTSGATGLHVYIPLAARYSYDQVRQFGQLIARLVHSRTGEWTSLERSPSKRQGRVYLDYLQNRRGQTLAAPYSVRPRAGATVSTPLLWDEVTPKLNPGAFTIRTMRERLDKLGDLWRPVLGPGIDLAAFLEKAAQ